MLKLVSRFAGDPNEKELSRLQPLVDKVGELESSFKDLTDKQLRAKTSEFIARLRGGESLDDLLPEAFACVREASKRTTAMRHFDVQILGGIILHQGKVVEMKTGEGKTLVATLPLYLNGLAGRGAHLITVNDYLAQRDVQWMGPIYHLLGLTVGLLQQGQENAFIYDPEYTRGKFTHLRPVDRTEAYHAHITHGTNHEFGFDYLRDNLAFTLDRRVQRELYYAIIDEVDNILIDEARTPLIISGPSDEPLEQYTRFARIARKLQPDVDYEIDEKENNVILTDAGLAKVEAETGIENIYDEANYQYVHYMEQALKAQVLFRKDRDYIKQGQRVVLVDEFTGRLMPDRRLSEGLHQAIEAKERVKIQRESVTLATITFQNYFRMYRKLAGMTGTAVTEAEEFHKIYKLEVVVVPTNRPLIRTEYPDQIYKDEKTKFAAVAREIKQLSDQKRPVLIGTTSIEKSELLSDLLTKNGVPHQVLNAKYHEKEAAIIAQAGRLGAVTVATNMAGRGVDIILGGNPGDCNPTEWQEEHNRVVELGGLHIVGTEHHEARRIDNQLRGRAGRQGDPGSSRFYASMEDEIVSRFGGDRVKGIMQWAGMDENTPIEHSFATKAMTNSQVQTEGYHFNIRKHLVEYDDVVNTHREVIYAERKKILSGADLKTNILSMVRDEIQGLVTKYLNSPHLTSPFKGEEGGEGGKEQSGLSSLLEDLSTIHPLPQQFRSDGLSGLGEEQMIGKLTDYATELYNQREQELGPENMRIAERLVLLRVIDRLWMEHLTAMEHLRQGIGLRAVGQEQPLVVYKREGHACFEALLASIQHDVAHTIYHVGLAKEAPQKKKEAVPAGKRAGRNDPCPCGSGKKYKHCCGK